MRRMCVGRSLRHKLDAAPGGQGGISKTTAARVNERRRVISAKL